MEPICLVNESLRLMSTYLFPPHIFIKQHSYQTKPQIGLSFVRKLYKEVGHFKLQIKNIVQDLQLVNYFL